MSKFCGESWVYGFDCIDSLLLSRVVGDFAVIVVLCSSIVIFLLLLLLVDLR